MSTSYSAMRYESLRREAEWLFRNPLPGATKPEAYALYTLRKLRMEAQQIIAESTLDLDFLAFLSKEKAAGRTYSSEALAKQVFSQAGVVAPPESPTDRISPVLGKGSQNGL